MMGAKDLNNREGNQTRGLLAPEALLSATSLSHGRLQMAVSPAAGDTPQRVSLAPQRGLKAWLAVDGALIRNPTRM